MKKIYTIAVTLLVALGATAQTDDQTSTPSGGSSPLKFGVKAGLNLSHLTGYVKEGINENNSGSSSTIGGALVGAYINYGFSDLLGTQAEVAFSMQGGSQRAASQRIRTTRLNYINVPLLLDIKPVENFSILVGPQFGFCVNRSSTLSDAGEDAKKDAEKAAKEAGVKIEDEWKYFKDFDLAIAVGAEYTFAEHLTIGLRYNIGLTNSYSYSENKKDKAGKEIKNDKEVRKGLRNNVFQISAGWTF